MNRPYSLTNRNAKWRIQRLAFEAFLNYCECELFRIGLRELGLVGGKEYWWDCELFQIGLKEVGLAAFHYEVRSH